MRNAQSTKHALTGRCDLQGRFASVLLSGAPLHQTTLGRAPDKVDGAVMPDLQALGDDPDRGPFMGAERLQDEEELVLLRLNVGGTGGCLAEREEATNLVTQLTESPVLSGVEIIDAGHGTMSLHDISWPRGLRQRCRTGQVQFTHLASRGKLDLWAECDELCKAYALASRVSGTPW